MAYINADEVKEMRERIRNAFSQYKWSVTCKDMSTVKVSLLESDMTFDKAYTQINPYYIREHYANNPKARDVFLTVLDIITGIKPHVDRNAGNPSADYCDCNYYIRMEIGQWDHPHKTIRPVKAKTVQAAPAAKVGTRRKAVHTVSDRVPLVIAL